MELQYFGHACVALRAASGQLPVMDPPEFTALWKGTKQRLGPGWQALPAAADGETSVLELSF